MGSRLIEFTVAPGSNSTVLVEVEDDEDDNVPVARGVVERASRTFEEVLAQVRPAIDVVVAQLGQLAVKPNQTSVEFGIRLSAGADAWIAKTGVEANLKVTFTFKS
jgi:hypothetical protein